MKEINVDEIIGHIGEILNDRQKRKGVLIHTFQRIQQEYNYLPAEVLRELSHKLNIPLSEIYSTASFYKQFYFTPRGKNIIKVCTGTACHVRGSERVLRYLEKEFNIDRGGTTPDLSVTLETVGCIGCCGLAPAAMVNEDIVGEIDLKKIEEIVETIKNSKE